MLQIRSNIYGLVFSAFLGFCDSEYLKTDENSDFFLPFSAAPTRNDRLVGEPRYVCNFPALQLETFNRSKRQKDKANHER